MEAVLFLVGVALVVVPHTLRGRLAAVRLCAAPPSPKSAT
jgi:hypothetical protein